MLTGMASDHLSVFKQNYPNFRPEFLVHPEVLADLEQLKKSAKSAGFELCLISSFRSFEAQKKIWNEKAQGLRALLDDDGTPLPFDQLERREVLEAIMRWSALPGASRHHWGTDIDVIDFNSLPSADYQVRLTAQEVADDGPFGAFHQWLDEQIASNHSYSFYRPYEFDLGGIAAERWHLSHFKTAQHFAHQYSLEFFLEHLAQAQFELKDEVIASSTEIYKRYLSATTPAPWA